MTSENTNESPDWYAAVAAAAAESEQAPASDLLADRIHAALSAARKSGRAVGAEASAAAFAAADEAAVAMWRTFYDIFGGQR